MKKVLSSSSFVRQLKPRVPAGGMIVFPVGLDYNLYQAAVTRVLAGYSVWEWQFGQGFRGKNTIDGILFNFHSLTVEITGIGRAKLLEAASVLTRKCAVAKVLVKDFEWGDLFVVNRALAKEEGYETDFINRFYQALAEENVIQGNEFRHFMEPNAKYRFPTEFFHRLYQAKKQFLRYFFLTIDKYPYNTDLSEK